MASTPGFLYNWPWHKAGNMKYLLYVPFAMKALIYANYEGRFYEKENVCFHLLMLAGMRCLLMQLWSTASRLPFISSRYQIQTKGVRFEQVDREANWENLIILVTIVLWGLHSYLPSMFTNLIWWDTRGIVLAFLAHAGPVEFTYYWAHRALHHYYLFNRYHSHHHSSFIPEPNSSIDHPFLENILYLIIIGQALLIPFLVGYGSFGLFYTYTLWFDFMNSMGHCNFEFVPVWLLEAFPIIKYLVYTPTFHSLHHSQLHSNFSLFMPLYDYLYGTVDKSVDSLHHFVRKGRENHVDCVYLTHATHILSFFHFQFGIRSLAAHPYAYAWYTWILWPIAIPIMFLLWLVGATFVSDKQHLDNLDIQTWVIPRFNFQFHLVFERSRINKLIEKSIIDAQKAGAKVIALGLMNKEESLNNGGELFMKKNKGIHIPIVTGSTLSASLIVHQIPMDVKEVFLIGAASKTGKAIALYLCMHGKRVLALVDSRSCFDAIHMEVAPQYKDNLVHVTNCKAGQHCKAWVVGEEISAKNQHLAPTGTHFYQFTYFPVSRVRKDCTYGNLPAFRLPKNIENLHNCEGTMPRYVVSVSHAAGILHALEGWTYSEADSQVDVHVLDSTFVAALKHGLAPIMTNVPQCLL